MPQVTIREGLAGASVPDTYVTSYKPAANFGSGATVFIGYKASSADTLRGIFEFDLSVIPAGASITAAKLTLGTVTASSAARPVKVLRLVQPGWVESEATWNEYSAGESWSTPGGDFTVTDEVAWTLPTATGDFDITGLETLVVDAIANRSAELHILLGRPVGVINDGWIEVRSGEGVPSGERPRLIVDYETTPPPMWYYRLNAKRRSA